MVVRPLHAEDLAAVAELEQMVQLEPWSQAQVWAIEPMLASGEYLGAVATVDDVLTGYVLARVLPQECEILSVGVAREQQGRGHGRAVVARWLAQLPSEIERVHLEVRQSNFAAQALYRRIGFAEVGRRKGYYSPLAVGAAREDALLMCWERNHG